jgi:hypothetical protein
MKKGFRRILIALLIIFILIQIFRPTKNKSDKPSPNDISAKYDVPENVSKILKASCYDCHSNNTIYPWYSEVQPVAWWLNNHITEGKKELNFSEFAGYAIRRQYKKLEEINDQVKKDEMPLRSYLIIHAYAKLDSLQKSVVANWVAVLRHSIEANYPPDSLKKKP